MPRGSSRRSGRRGDGPASSVSSRSRSSITSGVWAREFAGGRPPQAGEPARGGDLNVVITKAKPAYIQRNGVPYSANAVITEHYDLVKEADGVQYLIVTTLIEDPTYLARPYQRSTHFRKQADATGWDPTPCALR